MLTIKAVHIYNLHHHTLQPKIAKDYGFSNADGQIKIKYGRTTKNIVHLADSAKNEDDSNK